MIRRSLLVCLFGLGQAFVFRNVQFRLLLWALPSLLLYLIRSICLEVIEVDDDDVERARPAATTTRQWRPLRGQEGTSDHTRRVLELAGLPQRHRGGFEL